MHRRLAGAFLVNMKLQAQVPCKAMLDEVYSAYEFGPQGEDVVEAEQ